MKHISYAFARSTLEMEGKYFWNVFNQWLLESWGYTLLILECVCVQEKGQLAVESIYTHVR